MEESIIAQFFAEYQKLRAKADFADELLQYYDRESMTFNIPEKWRSLNRIAPDKRNQLPASPRHKIALQMQKIFTYSQVEYILPWDRLHEKAS